MDAYECPLDALEELARNLVQHLYVGTTTLTFDIAHMVSRLGLRSVVLDYDP